MKIQRYVCPNGYKDGKWKDLMCYAYIWANFFERRVIDKMIAEGRTEIRRHPHRGFVTSAHYILRPKRAL